MCLTERWRWSSGVEVAASGRRGDCRHVSGRASIFLASHFLTLHLPIKVLCGEIDGITICHSETHCLDSAMDMSLEDSGNYGNSIPDLASSMRSSFLLASYD
jgi:hypothetical protein